MILIPHNIGHDYGYGDLSRTYVIEHSEKMNVVRMTRYRKVKPSPYLLDFLLFVKPASGE